MQVGSPAIQQQHEQYLQVFAVIEQAHFSVFGRSLCLSNRQSVKSVDLSKRWV